jgi:acetyl esterase/lipase
MLTCEEEFLGTRCDPRAPAAVFSRAALTDHIAGMPLQTLWVHGSLDEQIPPSQALAWQRALVRVGRKDRVEIVPGAGHGFDLADDENAESARREVIGFLRGAFAARPGR